jgi:hypothetical protein
MRWPTGKRVLVLRASEASGRRIRTIARWAHALVPAAVLVVTPFDDSRAETRKDSIVLDADEVASGPLSLADAIARAAGASAEPGEH